MSEKAKVKAQIPAEAYTPEEVEAIEAQAEAAPQAKALGRFEWPDPNAPKEKPATTFQKDGALAVLVDEMLHGHAPNAVEPTTAAQIMAPMPAPYAILPRAAMKAIGVANAAGHGAETAGEHAGGFGAVARRLAKGASTLFLGHELGKIFGGGHH